MISSGAGWIVEGLLLAALGSLLAAHLSRVGYSRWIATLLAWLAIAQPAYLGAHALRSALASLSAFGVAASANAFLERQDPRRIVLLGSSLAGAQLANPLWGIVASVVVPLAVKKSLPSIDSARLAGLYISLLFIPVLMAITLAIFLATEHHSWPWPTLTGISEISLNDRASQCVLILLTSAPLLLALKVGQSYRDCWHVLPLSMVIVMAALVAVWLGKDARTLALESGATLAALALALISMWPPAPWRSGKAILAGMASPALCWTVCLMTGPSHG